MKIGFRSGVIFLIALLMSSGCQSPAEPSEPSPQSKKGTVVLLHGLYRSASSMETLETALTEAGYEICNIDYPSTEYVIEVLAREHVLPEIESCLQTYASAGGTEPVHFVTHSMGGIILRYLVDKGFVDNAGRTVMLGPPNHGSELVDELGEMGLFQWMNGPAGNQLGTADTSFVNQLPPVSFEVGVIAGSKSYNPVYSELIPGDDDGKVSVERARVEGMKDFLVLPLSHTFMMNDPEVISQILTFFSTGTFSHAS